MSRNIPNILKRHEKNQGTKAKSIPIDTSLKINENVKVIILKVIPDELFEKEVVLNKDEGNVSSDDSDIQVISSSNEAKTVPAKNVKNKSPAKNVKNKSPAKNVKNKSKRSRLLKKSKVDLNNTVLIPKQHKPLSIPSNNSSLKDKNIKNKILVNNLLHLPEEGELRCDTEIFHNNEDIFNQKGEKSLVYCFQSDQLTKELEDEINISEETAQYMDKTKLESIKPISKHLKNKSKILNQSETLDTLNNDTNLNNVTCDDDETGTSFEDLLELADDERFPDIHHDSYNESSTEVEDASNSNDILNVYVDLNQKNKSEFKSQSTNQSVDARVNIEAEQTMSSLNSVGDVMDFSEMEVTMDMSLDSNSISNSDSNDKGLPTLTDFIAAKNDPSIIENVPLNINNVGDTLLSTNDTESLNALVKLKCNNCLELIECPDVEPQMQCPKCYIKYVFQCKICTSGFVSLYSLYTHLIKFHSRGDAVHTLKIQPQYIKKPRPIKRLRCDPQEIYNCQKCGASFTLKTIKDKHEAICSRNPMLNCSFCSLAMSFRKCLKAHMISVHSELFDVNEVDSIINKIVKDGNKKRREMKATSILQTLQVASCQNCDTRTSIHEMLDGETTCAICSGNLVFRCLDPNCLRVFSTAKSLNTHVRMLHIERREHYRCAHCQYATMSTKDLMKHQKNCGDLMILPPRLFFCPSCNKGFKKERYLQVHLSRPEACARNKQRELICPKCSRSFRMQHWLENHQCKPARKAPTPPQETGPIELVPLEEPEYPCPDCGKVFRQMRWFNNHKTKFCQKQRVLYRCAHCRYQGFDKKKLKVHMRCAHVHLCTGKKLRCSKCGTSWTSIYSLNKHLDNCTGSYELEMVKMRRKKKKAWNEVFEYV